MLIVALNNIFAYNIGSKNFNNIESEIIKVKADFVDGGYYFNCQVDVDDHYIDGFRVIFDDITCYEQGRTSNKNFFFNLEERKGYLNYRGYRDLRIEVLLNEAYSTSRTLSVLGFDYLDSQDVTENLEIVYVRDNDSVLLSDKIEIVEEPGALFPVELNFKMDNFISLYVDEQLENKLSYSFTLGEKTISLQSKFNSELNKFSMVSDEVRYEVNPGIYDSQFTITYKRYFKVNLKYSYKSYFKKILGQDNYSQYKLIFGEK